MKTIKKVSVSDLPANHGKIIDSFNTSDDKHTNAPSLNAVDNRIKDKNIYSTTEQEIGIWIDGKPLYRKVIDNINMNGNTQLSFPHNISNLKFVVTVRGIGYQSANNRNIISIPSAYNPSSGGYWITCFYHPETNGIMVQCGDNYKNFSNGKFIIEYTKTTD